MTIEELPAEEIKNMPHWLKCRWFMAQSSAFVAAPRLTDDYLSDLSTNALNVILGSNDDKQWRESLRPIEIVRLINYIRALENRTDVE